MCNVSQTRSEVGDRHFFILLGLGLRGGALSNAGRLDLALVAVEYVLDLVVELLGQRSPGATEVCPIGTWLAPRHALPSPKQLANMLPPTL